MEKDVDKESFTTTLHNKTTSDLSRSEIDKNEKVAKQTQKLSISDKKQALGKLKNELIQEQQITQKSHTENGPTLTKKRK